MIKLFCDVCGKEVKSKEENPRDTDLTGYILMSKNEIELSCGKIVKQGFGTVRVCEDCREKISEFIISLIK